MRVFLVITYFFLLFACHLEATPSSLFWTNCTTEVQECGVPHLDVDTYFTVFNRINHGEQLPTDVGLLIGIFSWRELHGEAGIDYLGGTDYPFFFNTKVGIEENKLFKYAPSMSVGIFNIGTRTRTSKRTNQNVVDLVVGKELPKFGGHLYIGGYVGTKALGPTRGGFMIGYEKKFCKAKFCDDEEYFKWAFAFDYASGKNAIGGGGFCLEYFFTPKIYLQTGPVWFGDAHINGRWKWGMQLNFDFPPIYTKKEKKNGNGSDKEKTENGNSKKNGNDKENGKNNSIDIKNRTCKSQADEKK